MIFFSEKGPEGSCNDMIKKYNLTEIKALLNSTITNTLLMDILSSSLSLFIWSTNCLVLLVDITI